MFSTANLEAYSEPTTTRRTFHDVSSALPMYIPPR